MNGTKVKNLNLSEMDLVNLDSIPMILIKKSSKFKILPLRLAAVLTTIELVCGE